MRMEAAVLDGPAQPIHVREVELDRPRAGEALVRIAASGLCGRIGTLPSGTKLTLAADPLIEEKRIAGCYLGAASPERDVPALVERYLEGELRLDELVSRRIVLAELDDGFARLREGTEARQVVVFTHREESHVS